MIGKGNELMKGMNVQKREMDQQRLLHIINWAPEEKSVGCTNPAPIHFPSSAVWPSSGTKRRRNKKKDDHPCMTQAEKNREKNHKPKSTSETLENTYLGMTKAANER